ncbi:MAG: hypothetical protein VYE22_26895 [Myxococcota bacterium]|nr:hypothetical protein [Myxococcota bacterium]
MIRQLALLAPIVLTACSSPVPTDAGHVDAARPERDAQQEDAAPPDAAVEGCPVVADGVSGCLAHGEIVTLEVGGLGEKINPEVPAGAIDDAVPSIWMMGDDLRFNGVPSDHFVRHEDGAPLSCHASPSNPCDDPDSPWASTAGVTMDRSEPRHPRVEGHLHLEPPRDGSRHTLGGAIGGPVPLVGHAAPLDRGVLAWWARWTHDPTAYRRYVVRVTTGELSAAVPSGEWPRPLGEAIHFPDTEAYGQRNPTGRLLRVDPGARVLSFVFDDDSQVIFGGAAVGERFVLQESGVEGVVERVEFGSTSHKLFRTHHPRIPTTGQPEPGVAITWTNGMHLQVILNGHDHDGAGEIDRIAVFGVSGSGEHVVRHARHVEERIPREVWRRYEMMVDRSEPSMIQTFLHGAPRYEGRPLDDIAAAFRITETEPARRGGAVEESGVPFRGGFTIGRLGVDVSGNEHGEVYADLGELYFDRTSALHLVLSDAADPRDADELAHQLPLRWRDGAIRFQVNAGGHERLAGRWLLVRDGTRVLHRVPLRAP